MMTSWRNCLTPYVHADHHDIVFESGSTVYLVNDGGVFRDEAPALGLADPRRSVGAVWFDADEDGDLDVAVANMDGDANGLFRNDGARFVGMAAAAGVAWGGPAPQDPGPGRGLAFLRLPGPGPYTPPHAHLALLDIASRPLLGNKQRIQSSDQILR